MITCSVCDKEFTPKNDYDFVCRDCQNSLVGHCCGSDDVHMDWGVGEGFSYYWEIVCFCGRAVKSRQHYINELDIAAKELHSAWIADSNLELTAPALADVPDLEEDV